MNIRHLLVLTVLPWAIAAQEGRRPPDMLLASATTALETSLQMSAAHRPHVWRDSPPVNEVFNVLNKANFDVPNPIFGTANFGRIFSAKNAREMQLGAKLSF